MIASRPLQNRCASRSTGISSPQFVCNSSRASNLSDTVLRTSNLSFIVLAFCFGLRLVFFNVLVFSTYLHFDVLVFSMHSYSRCYRILCLPRIRLSLYSYCESFSEKNKEKFRCRLILSPRYRDSLPPFESPIFHREDSTVLAPLDFAFAARSSLPYRIPPLPLGGKEL